MKDTKCKCKFI